MQAGDDDSYVSVQILRGISVTENADLISAERLNAQLVGEYRKFTPFYRSLRLSLQFSVAFRQRLLKIYLQLELTVGLFLLFIKLSCHIKNHMSQTYIICYVVFTPECTFGQESEYLRMFHFAHYSICVSV